MEFESPDVEREFPGLYASESGGKRSNDSDFSDESFDSKLSKKDLLIGKRKEKKDRGYATLEGESSPDEELDVKSPSKSKKSKPFKFSTKSKEKREKSKEKDVKELVEKEKDVKKKDKEKSSKTKEKEKVKERKKVKSGDGSGDIAEEAPIFGVTLELANERCPCHDGVNIPLVLRACIDHVESHGLTTEQVYKVSGLKSKVQQLKQMYNRREPVSLASVDIPVVTSLLKLFLRELAEPVVGSELLGKCEDVAGVKDLAVRESELRRHMDRLSPVNRMVLAWLVSHLNRVSAQERQNKMSSQALASVLAPVLQMSSKLLTALLFHCEAVLPPVELKKYVPPLTCASPALPETVPAIQEELRKQDSLLSQLHAEMNAGFVSKQREEQLWEVQRMITQLKRKLRILEKGSVSQRSVDEVCPTEDSEFALNLNLQQVEDMGNGPAESAEKLSQNSKPSTSADQKHASAEPTKRFSEAKPGLSGQDSSTEMTKNLTEAKLSSISINPSNNSTKFFSEVKPSVSGKNSSIDPGKSFAETKPEVKATSAEVRSIADLGPGDAAGKVAQSAGLVSNVSVSPHGSIQSSSVSLISADICESLPDEGDSACSTLSEAEFILKGLKLETIELTSLANTLQEAVLDEKLRIASLYQQILSHPNFDNNMESLTMSLTCDDGADPTSELVRESLRLENQKENLVRSIIEEREAILDLKVQILMKQGGPIPV